MRPHPWFRYPRTGNALLRETIVQAINHCGVALEPAQKSPPMGAGLVLFDSMDAQLCETIDRDSRRRWISRCRKSNPVYRTATTRKVIEKTVR